MYILLHVAETIEKLACDVCKVLSFFCKRGNYSWNLLFAWYNFNKKICSVYLLFQFVSSLLYLFWLNLCQINVSQSINWCVHLCVCASIFLYSQMGEMFHPNISLTLMYVFCHPKRKGCFFFFFFETYSCLIVSLLYLEKHDGYEGKVKTCSWASEYKKYVSLLKAFPLVLFYDWAQVFFR